jgi:hypothetical protein
VKSVKAAKAQQSGVAKRMQNGRLVIEAGGKHFGAAGEVF